MTTGISGIVHVGVLDLDLTTGVEASGTSLMEMHGATLGMTHSGIPGVRPGAGTLAGVGTAGHIIRGVGMLAGAGEEDSSVVLGVHHCMATIMVDQYTS